MEPIQQCAFWVQRKNRFCKLTAPQGQTYCGEHRPVAASESCASDTDRVPCPLDEKHTVYKKNLHKHLKICNARPVTDLPPYITKGINNGDTLNGAPDYNDLRITDIGHDELQTLIKRIRDLYVAYIHGIITKEMMSHPFALDARQVYAQHGVRASKHIMQIDSLIGILKRENQLQPDTTFIEFGAGKGQLSLVLSNHLEKSGIKQTQLIVVDRLALRHKKDNHIGKNSYHNRLRVDIADLDLKGLDLLASTRRLVAVSKHLCGSATDLTLRCITQPSTTPTECALIALCCHQSCDWRTFVGKDFFASNNLSDRDFAIMTKMSSWAICGQFMNTAHHHEAHDQIGAQQQYGIEEILRNFPFERLQEYNRETIGMMCKRLLDFARMQYLQQHGYRTKLVYYVPRETTLENVCLIAQKTVHSADCA